MQYHNWYVDSAKRCDDHGRGVRRRRGAEAPQTRCTLDHTAFDLETPESCYWIGFLMADGCVIKPATGSHQIVLVLKKSDYSHVQKLKVFLKSSHKISNLRNAVRFAVTSDGLASALAKYGVVPRKSYTAKVTGLEFDRDFWRGVIDGDGCIGLSKRKLSNAPRLELVGSKELLDQFRSFATTVIPNSLVTVVPHKSIYKIGYGGNLAGDLVRHLYQDCIVSLDRKMERAGNIIEHVTPEAIKGRKMNSILYRHGGVSVAQN